MKILQNYLDLCPEFSKKQEVIPDIHPEDFIFKFLVENPVFKVPEHAVNYYFSDGRSSAQKLRDIIQNIGGIDKPFTLLEFASGYGCVTRHFANVLPEVTVTSCDIHPAAMDFISKRIGVQTILSSSIPEQLSISSKYDVVFALSFFSHMPRKTWTRWLNSLLYRVKPGGFLIFTTHGFMSRPHLGNPRVDQDGFWFSTRSEQKDLDKNEYGLTLTTPSFVFQQVNYRESRMVFFQERYWWDHQDIYVIKAQPFPR